MYRCTALHHGYAHPLFALLVAIVLVLAGVYFVKEIFTK